MAKSTGKVVQVLGGVVDCEFPEEGLPALFDAIEIKRPGQHSLILEVQKHLGNSWVRCVGMDTTDGLERGAEAIGTGSAIRVPVGPATLGRIFNVLGRPVDNAGPVEATQFHPIHPDFSDKPVSHFSR